ncbi:MAG: hypothetical protein IPL32_20470 [Chloracidobacterium sp.]|nr:hypothetical protein [Chloracidobacterium sp.]
MTSDTNRNGSQDEEVWTSDMDADQATLSETVNTYTIIFGSSAGGEERNDEWRETGWELEGIGKRGVVGGVTSLSHKGNQSEATLLYGFNRVGQLVKRDRRTVSEANYQKLRTPRRDARLDGPGETRYRAGGWTMSGVYGSDGGRYDIGHEPKWESGRGKCGRAIWMRTRRRCRRR